MTPGENEFDTPDVDGLKICVNFYDTTRWCLMCCYMPQKSPGEKQRNKQDIIRFHEITKVVLDIIFHLLCPTISLYYFTLDWTFF